VLAGSREALCLLARGRPLCALPSRRALLGGRGSADRSPGKQRRGRPRAGRLRRRLADPREAAFPASAAHRTKKRRPLAGNSRGRP